MFFRFLSQQCALRMVDFNIFKIIIVRNLILKKEALTFCQGLTLMIYTEIMKMYSLMSCSFLQTSPLLSTGFWFNGVNWSDSGEDVH